MAEITGLQYGLGISCGGFPPLMPGAANLKKGFVRLFNSQKRLLAWKANVTRSYLVTTQLKQFSDSIGIGALAVFQAQPTRAGVNVQGASKFSSALGQWLQAILRVKSNDLSKQGKNGLEQLQQIVAALAGEVDYNKQTCGGLMNQLIRSADSTARVIKNQIEQIARQRSKTEYDQVEEIRRRLQMTLISEDKTADRMVEEFNPRVHYIGGIRYSMTCPLQNSPNQTNFPVSRHTTFRSLISVIEIGGGTKANEMSKGNCAFSKIVVLLTVSCSHEPSITQCHRFCPN